MNYLWWVALGLQLTSFALIFAAFIPIGQRQARDGRKFFFRPWLLAYGALVFVLWSLLDIFLRLNGPLER